MKDIIATSIFIIIALFSGFMAGRKYQEKIYYQEIIELKNLVSTRNSQLERIVEAPDSNYVVIDKLELEILKEYQTLYYETKGTFNKVKRFHKGDKIRASDINEIWDSISAINSKLEYLK